MNMFIFIIQLSRKSKFKNEYKQVDDCQSSASIQHKRKIKPTEKAINNVSLSIQYVTKYNKRFNIFCKYKYIQNQVQNISLIIKYLTGITLLRKIRKIFIFQNKTKINRKKHI